MSLKNTKQGWGSVAKSFHWLVALFIIGLLIFGSVMDAFKGDTAEAMIRYVGIVNMHKTFGLIALFLVGLRFAWRAANPTPAPLPGPAWQIKAASVTHWALYALMIIVPISGYIASSASQYPHDVFGWFNVPKLTPIDHDLHELGEEIHEIGTTILIALILLHFAASLKHHLIDKDATLKRMLPGAGAAATADEDAAS